MNDFLIDKNLFAMNMKNFRKKLNLTQVIASEKLNITRTSLMNYESGKSLPEITTLLNICMLYKCSLNALLGIDTSNLIELPSFNESKDSDIPILLNNFKAQLSTLTSLNLKHIKLNNEVKAEKNKLILNNKRLISSKNKYLQLIDSLNKSQEKCTKLMESLSATKDEYNKLIAKLKKSQDFHLNSTKDIDETRDYFLSSFSNILNNANNLVNELETSFNLKELKKDTKSIVENQDKLINLNEETSSELVPEIDFNKSNYIDDETEYYDDTEEETVKVSFIPNTIAAGEPIGYLDSDTESFIRLKTRYPLTKDNYDEFYIITVKGDSMNRIVDDGERILVRSTSCVENGTLAVVNLVDETSSTLKYYYYDPVKRLVTLKPYSTDPTYKDMVFDADKRDIIVQGEYIGDISDFL